QLHRLRRIFSNKELNTVWSIITVKNWMLATEMEADTLHIANLALVEPQIKNQVSSFM
ncbi:hypothetical protein F441_11943, partial [Phytophthora nicotianae CJ01A1]